MRVSELSRRTGVSIHRLRRWESAGLVPARRTESGVREFGEDAIRAATFVSMGRDLGFDLAGISDVLPRYADGTLSIEEMLDLFAQRLLAVERQIHELTDLRGRLVDHVAWFEARRTPGAATSPDTSQEQP